MIRNPTVSSRSRPKPPLPPITARIEPPARRIALQGRLRNDIPHYVGASDYHTHHALEVVERAVSEGRIPNILDSDEQVVGYLYGRAEVKYGSADPLDAAPLPEWFGTATKQGYDLYYKLG